MRSFEDQASRKKKKKKKKRKRNVLNVILLAHLRASRNRNGADALVATQQTETGKGLALRSPLSASIGLLQFADRMG